MSRPFILLSCEHGGNRVPARYRALFAGQEVLLRSHRGWDPGALKLAQALARRWAAPLFASTTTRLLVELNRSLGHPALFSALTRGLSGAEREAILCRYYRPYREAVEREIRSRTERGLDVLHISVHSFTPVLDGEVRTADVGLLYDPARPAERAPMRAWQEALRAGDPALRVRCNYPYLGTSDGFTTWLRRRYPEGYRGVEIEVNQGLLASGRRARDLCDRLAATLLQVLEQGRGSVRRVAAR